MELHLTEAGSALREEALQVPGRVVAASGLSIDELQRVKEAADAVIATAYGTATVGA